MAEDEMERRGIHGQWTIMGPSLLRFGFDFGRGTSVSFKIEKTDVDDDMELALNGDILNDVTKVLKVRYSFHTLEGHTIKILDTW